MSTLTRLPVHQLRHGDGFRAAGVRGQPGQLDPFLMADLFAMREPTFGPHPHAGFSAITYLLDDSETGFRNRDSRGDDSIIAAGDVHWTLAGAGVLHDEVPLQPGRWARGLQLFIKLPASTELQPPRALHLDAASMPRLVLGDNVRLKLVFGRFGNDQAPLELPQDVTLLDLQVPAATSAELPLPVAQAAIFIGVRGVLWLGDVELRADQAVLADGAAVLRLAADEDSQALVLLGRPLREPVSREGPFALSSPQRLAQAVAAYRAGAMGRLA